MAHHSRANPYPEVTDLFCRLPLSTLFYQLKAVNLASFGLLSFIWCEKSSGSCKQLWIYYPGSRTKLFDGIGVSVKDKVERVLIECSG
ncbi:unnamed protein product [Absidia cylindrospora]